MAITLTKIVNGKPASDDAMPDAVEVKCPRCEQLYKLGYSENEWNKVKDWRRIAETAIRKDHNAKHETDTIPLEWRGLRRR